MVSGGRTFKKYLYWTKAMIEGVDELLYGLLRKCPQLSLAPALSLVCSPALQPFYNAA